MSGSARPGGRVLIVIGVVLMALTLRIAVASLSPVIDRIAGDFPLPAALVGLIGMAPPAAFAAAGLLTPPLERRLGLERLALCAVVVAALGLAARSLAVNAVSLLVVTVVLFAAVGIGNVLLPGIAKKYFPDRVGVLTALYTTAMAVATFVPPLVAVPLADSWGWRLSFTVWAAVAAAAIVPWIVITVRARAFDAGLVERPRADVVRRLVRLPLAWALAATFAVNSSVAYAAFAWLPVILVDVAHTTAQQAGALLALFAFMGLPCSFFVPLLVSRYRVVGALYVVAVTSGIAGIAGLLFVPTVATPLWVALLGLPPLLFPMLLVLIGLRTRTHDTAVALSGFVQSIGYGFAALAPLAIGLVHEATGEWTGSLILLGAVMTIAIPAGFVVARGRTIEDEWEQRHGAW
ncbi:MULTISPECIES: CynX/NimT family MFS transporter [unclassified Microbacterium]|uniref:MFS transporter n=1 Tax=unclassified Microbacterium TaxID=2609290 RepID=UPI003744E3C9